MQDEHTAQAAKGEGPRKSNAIGFPCRQCGNQMAYRPEKDKLYCEYCQSEVEIPGEASEAAEYMYFPDEDRYDAPQWETEPGQLLTCPSCGADTVIGAAAMTASCPFCSSHYVTEAPADAKIILPETMMPFRISEQAAREQFTGWAKKQWLAPRAFQKEAKRQEMRGVYIPFWTFDASLDTSYSGFGGRRRVEHYTVRVNGKTQTRTRTRTDWYPVSGRMHMDFDNVPCPATAKLDRGLLDKLGGFSLKILHPYNPAYLAGFLAERYSIGLAAGFETVRRLMDRRMEAHIEASLGYDTYRGMRYHHHYEAVKFKHILLPVWLSAYSYHGKTYQFLVNGETGKPAGHSPLSALKIALLVGAGILAAGLLILLMMTLGQ